MKKSFYLALFNIIAIFTSSCSFTPPPKMETRANCNDPDKVIEKMAAALVANDFDFDYCDLKLGLIEAHTSDYYYTYHWEIRKRDDHTVSALCWHLDTRSTLLGHYSYVNYLVDSTTSRRFTPYWNVRDSFNEICSDIRVTFFGKSYVEAALSQSPKSARRRHSKNKD